MKIFFSSFFGVISGLLFLVLLVIGLASIPSGKIEIAPKSTLVLDLNGVIQDRPTNSLALLSELLDQPEPLSLTQTLLAMDAARKDDRIEALHIHIGLFEMGYASIQELRTAIQALEAAGKPVSVQAKIYSQKAIYLARAASHVQIVPEGMVEISGLSASPLYLKGALDKAGIQAHLIRGSDNIYKSAGEPFIAEIMSEANRLQIQERLQSIWSQIHNDWVADGLDGDALETRLMVSPLFDAEEAKHFGLVDQISYTLNLDEEAESISVADYYRALEEPSARQSIAVLIAEGDVQDGNGSDGVITDGSLRKAIKKISKQKRVGAILLRINSPGGSALASDMIWGALSDVTDKPIIVSMGDVAASGGYYIAAPAQEIYASPATITGSIGVFGLLFSGEQLMHEHLGIRSQPVGSHPFSTALQLDQAPSEAFMAIMQKNVDHTYDRFKNVVAQGRKMERQRVDSLAQGHVYSGRDALSLGLVDREGGFLAALGRARELAGYTNDARIVFYPEDMDPIEEFINSLSSNINQSWSAWIGGPAQEWLNALQAEWAHLEQRQGIQMRAIDLNL
ncbi:MAG: signal peptide peptidase SppA [Schleiferiaceae bacterium]|nr:signal peptide peptidase SppA [Schleiferiaceae bacterium]